MILDCHIHIMPGPAEPSCLNARMHEAGIDGGMMLSLAPPCFDIWAADAMTWQDRLQNLVQWCKDSPNLFPLFWIDPTEDDALEQVRAAVAAGVSGFKCICSHFYPGDERALRVFREIAAHRKPLLFHSGILFDAQDSSRYNRPAEFEALLQVADLRFALAHISWPWCDELIAVFGKFQAARSQRKGEVAQMFVDMTPGTPGIYREEALRKLFTVGYDVAQRVMLGTDQTAGTYKPDRVKNTFSRDRGILHNLGVEETVISDVLGDNVRRFLGLHA